MYKDSSRHSLPNVPLRKLCTELPTAVVSGLSKNTVKQYVSGFKRWRAWCERANLDSLPVNQQAFCLFLLATIQSAASPSPVSSVLAAVKWACSLAHMPDPTISYEVRMLSQFAQRRLKKRQHRKKPASVDMIQQIVRKFAAADANLPNLRIALLCVLSFAGFLRFSELRNIRCSDLTFEPNNDCVKLTISQSKTDQYRDGDSILIAKLESECCPVTLLRRYLTVAELDITANVFIFRNVQFTKKLNAYKLCTRNVPITYSRARELYKSALQSLGFDVSLYGLHSLRSGGATAAANSGVNDRLFKRHGRWRSETAKDGYVSDDKKALLSVSRSLGL